MLLVAQWHREITAALEESARRTLAEAGVAPEDVRVHPVPGAYELPQAAAWVARAGDADAVIALGCVVRGETPHFEHVARACVDGLARVALETGVPVTLGVITADTQAQAKVRAGAALGKGGNKGVEAARAALDMVALYRSLEARRRPT